MRNDHSFSGAEHRLIYRGPENRDTGKEQTGPSPESKAKAQKNLDAKVTERKQREAADRAARVTEHVAQEKEEFAEFKAGLGSLFNDVPKEDLAQPIETPEEPTDTDNPYQWPTKEEDMPASTEPSRADTKPKNEGMRDGIGRRGGRGGGGNNININNNTVVVETGGKNPNAAPDRLSDAEQMAMLGRMNTQYTNGLKMRFPGLANLDVTPPALREQLATYKREAAIILNTELESNRAQWRVVEGPTASARLYFYNINKEQPPVFNALKPAEQGRIAALIKKSEIAVRNPRARFDMKAHVDDLNAQLLEGNPAVTKVHFEAPLPGFPSTVRIVGGAA